MSLVASVINYWLLDPPATLTLHNITWRPRLPRAFGLRQIFNQNLSGGERKSLTLAHFSSLFGMKIRFFFPSLSLSLALSLSSRLRVVKSEFIQLPFRCVFSSVVVRLPLSTRTHTLSNCTKSLVPTQLFLLLAFPRLQS